MNTDRGWCDLATAIVVQAAKDYRDICAGKRVKYSSIEDIEQFFKSRWCQNLCGRASALFIWRKLQEEQHNIKEDTK